jgi:hypothetical protein
MMQLEDEIWLEDYVERFTYNLQREMQGELDPKMWCVLFLRGIRDDCIELLNLMGRGDVSQLEYNIIVELFHKNSRGTSKTSKGPRDILERMGKTTRSGVMKEEIKNMLEDFKTNIISSLSSQMDTLQRKKKQEEIK